PYDARAGLLQTHRRHRRLPRRHDDQDPDRLGSASMSITTSPTATIERTNAARVPQKPEGSALLPAVMRSELTKLRSVRSTIWSLVATFGITVGFGALFSWAYISRYGDQSLQERLTFDPTA